MSIRYSSTRGGQSNISFEEVVLGGLADDKGLFIPEQIPKLGLPDIEKLRGLSFAELAFAIISTFVKDDEVPTDRLVEILDSSFKSFRSEEVVPCRKLEEFWVLELFHGPTFAFKDVALQFLGNLFEFFLTRGKLQTKLTVLGATSGDTGSAAIHGLRGKQNIDCFIMFPSEKVTEIQERQMTTVSDCNIHCISVQGDFDDCQAIVKDSFQNAEFRNKVNLGAINSINWARVLAQITYYFYSWLRVTDKHPHDQRCTTKLHYIVPTGNFGDILAGYYAKEMGLPIEKLVVATNENDVLHRFFQSGVYEKHTAVCTIAPSMDISISSNFERYLYYLANENGMLLKEWMTEFESTGVLTVSESVLMQAREHFLSFAAHQSTILAAMQSTYETEQYLVCPHTATAVVALQQFRLPASTSIVLATAHPAKFEAAIASALGGKDHIPPRPKEIEELFALPTRVTVLENHPSLVRNFILHHLTTTNH